MIAIIQASGYPLEMSLYDQFEKAGMDPAIGLIIRKPIVVTPPAFFERLRRRRFDKCDAGHGPEAPE